MLHDPLTPKRDLLGKIKKQEATKLTSSMSSLPQEEENTIDLVEDEDTGSDIWPDKPWNPAKIRITTKNFSLREVAEQINDDDIDLSPDFQREYVWKNKQRTRLVESILLGIPLPAFYFNQEEDGTFQVVDGVQRLSTVARFMSNSHILEKRDLEYLVDLGGRRYEDLDPASKRRFRSAQIVVHVIEPQTPDEVKYDIFGRVNTLGSPLSSQEIRHAMSKSRSRLFLHSLTRTSSFDEATDFNFWRRDPENQNAKVPNTGRMMNRELALRFCAFFELDVFEYRQYSGLNSYLSEFTKRIDGRSDHQPNLSDEQLDSLHIHFDRAMINAKKILGKKAFRRPATSKRGPINRAIFESQAIALSRYEWPQLEPHASEISKRFIRLFEDESYLRSVTVGTGDPRRVQARMEATAFALREILT